MDESAKILVLGLSQAGKSSFINYFIGADKAQIGKGEPCTTGYCIEYTYNSGRYPIKIYDNKGFETAIATEQKDIIINFVKEHNNSDQIMNWFHTIFYVTSANKRFEEFERDFILDLSKSISQNIHIIITCCDGVSKQTLEGKKRNIANQLSAIGDKLHIFEVVSVSMKKLGGEVVKPYGREEIIDSVFPLFWEDICSKISKEYARELYWDLNSIFDNFKAKLYGAIDKIVSINGLIAAINDDDSILNSIGSDIEGELDVTLESMRRKYNKIIKPLSKLFNSYYGTISDYEISIDDLNIYPLEGYDFDFDSDFLLEKYLPNMKKIANDDEINIFTVFGTIGELFSIKKRLKSAVDDMVWSAKRKVLSQGEIEEQIYNNLMEFLDHYEFNM